MIFHHNCALILFSTAISFLLWLDIVWAFETVQTCLQGGISIRKTAWNVDQRGTSLKTVDPQHSVVRSMVTLLLLLPLLILLFVENGNSCESSTSRPKPGTSLKLLMNWPSKVRKLRFFFPENDATWTWGLINGHECRPMYLPLSQLV